MRRHGPGSWRTCTGSATPARLPAGRTGWKRRREAERGLRLGARLSVRRHDFDVPGTLSRTAQSSALVRDLAPGPAAPQRNNGRPITPQQFASTRQRTHAAVAFLNSLTARGLTLETCRQSDLDRWLTDDSATYRHTAGHFIRWTRANKLASVGPRRWTVVCNLGAAGPSRALS
jgi:hypothetical protein